MQYIVLEVKRLEDLLVGEDHVYRKGNIFFKIVVGADFIVLYVTKSAYQSKRYITLDSHGKLKTTDAFQLGYMPVIDVKSVKQRVKLPACLK